jgi:hypothetical protein
MPCCTAKTARHNPSGTQIPQYAELGAYTRHVLLVSQPWVQRLGALLTVAVCTFSSSSQFSALGTLQLSSLTGPEFLRCSYHQAQPVENLHVSVRYQIAKLSISMAHHHVSGGISGIRILKLPYTH